MEWKGKENDGKEGGLGGRCKRWARKKEGRVGSGRLQGLRAPPQINISFQPHQLTPISALVFSIPLLHPA